MTNSSLKSATIEECGSSIIFVFNNGYTSAIELYIPENGLPEIEGGIREFSFTDDETQMVEDEITRYANEELNLEIKKENNKVTSYDQLLFNALHILVNPNSKEKENIILNLKDYFIDKDIDSLSKNFNTQHQK